MDFKKKEIDFNNNINIKPSDKLSKIELALINIQNMEIMKSLYYNQYLSYEKMIIEAKKDLVKVCDNHNWIQDNNLLNDYYKMVCSKCGKYKDIIE